MPPKTKAKFKPEAGSAAQNLISQAFAGVAEVTVSESAYHSDSLILPYNPDDLYQKAGDYSIYEDMLCDDQVSVCADIKRDLVIGSGFSILTEVDDREHDEIREDLEISLNEDLDTPFTEMLEEVLSAYNFGFSVSEKVFKRRPDGSLTFKYLKTRHPSTWLIRTDKHGNVEKYEQEGVDNQKPINPASLLHYINRPNWQNPYGRSDLRSAYLAWFAKRQITKYYGIFLEKAASPIPVGKYDKNAPADAVNDIFTALKSFQAKTAMVIPKEIEVEFLNSGNNGDAFIRGINIFNMFIGRAMFIPDLLGFQGDETSGGSYSLGKEQMGVLFRHIHRRRSTLESLVNKHIIWPLVVHNYGFVDKYPKFVLNPISDDQLLELAKVWLEAQKGKVYKPTEQEINHFRELAKFPKGDVEFYEPQEPAPSASPLFTLKGAKKKEFAKTAFDPPPGDYHKKVDFKAIEAGMDRFVNRIKDETAPVIDSIFESLFDQIEKKKIVPGQKIEKIDSLKIPKMRDMKLVLKKNLREAMVDGKMAAQKELLKGVFATPLPSDKFLEFLESELFQYIGKWAFDVDQQAQIELRKAIVDGRPLSSVIESLNQTAKFKSAQSLERFARTMTTKVMNRGRQEFFEDSGVTVAYQYSAILDARTSEICRGLHGKIFKAGTEPIPPMHFNCRSLLVPITKFEPHKPSTSVGKKSIDSFIESQLSGTGFSRR